MASQPISVFSTLQSYLLVYLLYYGGHTSPFQALIPLLFSDLASTDSFFFFFGYSATEKEVSSDSAGTPSTLCPGGCLHQQGCVFTSLLHFSGVVSYENGPLMYFHEQFVKVRKSCGGLYKGVDGFSFTDIAVRLNWKYKASQQL